nr:DUF3717 domain-containing protein [Paraburkholderia hayleyella]
MSGTLTNEREIEINFWRACSPLHGDEFMLCREFSAPSKPYALMIVQVTLNCRSKL